MATYKKMLKNRRGDYIIPAFGGQIETNDLADGAITTGKINDGAVTSGKIDFSTIGYSTLVYYSTSVYTVTTANTYYPIKSGTITTHGGRILFTGAVIAKLTGGGIAYLDAKIDNGTNTRACQSDVNDVYNTLAGSIVFDNIPAGTHTISYGVRTSKAGATLTINGYNWFSATFIEI